MPYITLAKQAGTDIVSSVQAFVQASCAKLICPKVFLVFAAGIDQSEILSHLDNQGIKEEIEDMQVYLGSFPSGTKDT